MRLEAPVSIVVTYEQTRGPRPIFLQCNGPDESIESSVINIQLVDRGQQGTINSTYKSGKARSGYRQRQDCARGQKVSANHWLIITECCEVTRPSDWFRPKAAVGLLALSTLGIENLDHQPPVAETKKKEADETPERKQRGNVAKGTKQLGIIRQLRKKYQESAER